MDSRLMFKGNLYNKVLHYFLCMGKSIKLLALVIRHVALYSIHSETSNI